METEELFKLASDALLEEYDSRRQVGKINVFEKGIKFTPEYQKTVYIAKKISEGYRCESRNGISGGNGTAMLIALSLGKENLEALLEEKDIDSKIERIRELKPLEGKTVLEVGGKRLSATAYGLGAQKATGFDAGHESADGGRDESFSLDTYLDLHPEQADITYSQWALEGGYGYISKARFSTYIETDTEDIDAMADVLSAISNTTKKGGYSVHSYSNSYLMDEFVKGKHKDFLNFIGFETIYHGKEEGDFGDKCVVFRKVSGNETDERSYLIRREVEDETEYKASLIRKENGRIVEEKLDLSMKDAIAQYTDMENMQAMPLNMEDVKPDRSHLKYRY